MFKTRRNVCDENVLLNVHLKECYCTLLIFRVASFSMDNPSMSLKSNVYCSSLQVWDIILYNYSLTTLQDCVDSSGELFSSVLFRCARRYLSQCLKLFQYGKPALARLKRSCLHPSLVSNGRIWHNSCFLLFNQFRKPSLFMFSQNIRILPISCIVFIE